MAYKVLRPKNHEEWLELRGKGIGSSEVGTIMGFNPWQTKLQLYNRKMGLDNPQEENEAMHMGHELEPYVASKFAKAMKKENKPIEIDPNSEGDWIAMDIDRPYLRCSPDRIYFKGGKGNAQDNICILECKTTQKDIDPDNPPFYWFCQLQYQMGIMGAKEGELAWLVRGLTFGHKHYYFDQLFFDQMVAAIEEFIKNHLDAQIPPKPETSEDVKLLYPKEYIGKVMSGKEIICIDPEADEGIQHNFSIMQVLREVKAINEHMAQLKDRKEQLIGAIQQKMEDAEAIVIDVEGKQKVLATWKSSKDSLKFNAKKFEKEHPDECEAYMELSKGTRRFLVK